MPPRASPFNTASYSSRNFLDSCSWENIHARVHVDDCDHVRPELLMRIRKASKPVIQCYFVEYNLRKEKQSPVTSLEYK